MICGWQVAFGDWTRPAAWCAERKAEGEAFCERHHQDAMDEYGVYYLVAEGTAFGQSNWQVRLLWEGDDPDVPVEASAEEMARYAGILTPERGE